MTTPIDDNLEQRADGTVACRHCGTAVGTAENPLRDARVREQEPAHAGPAVRAEPVHFTDRQVVLRLTFCPQCLTQLQAEIVPADEPSFRTRNLGVRQ
jgi:N-methylhydantoinase B